MTGYKNHHRGRLLATTVTLALLTASCAARQDDVVNHIAVILDASGSYSRRQPEAVAKATELVAQIVAQHKRHWEAADKVVIISMDSLPVVLFEGSPQELAKIGADNWARRFAGRKDFRGCTDVEGALRLAADRLADAPGVYSDKYAFVFSDLKVEPPAKGLSTCAPERATPGPDFDWSRLSDVSLTAFWMPPEQVAAWDRELRAHGQKVFRLYSQSESSANAIVAPKSPERTLSEAQKQASRGRAGAVLGYLLSGAGLLALVLLGAVAFLMRAPRRRSAPQHGGGRPVRGPIAPMRIPPRS